MMKLHPLRYVLLAAIILLPVTDAIAQQTQEIYRSPFGRPHGVAVDPTDGSCWAITGNSVMHVAKEGAVLSQSNGFWIAGDLSVDASNGLCWVTDLGHKQVVRLDRDGVELWRAGDFVPGGLSVDSTDSSGWVLDLDKNQLVHLDRDGKELWRGGEFWGPVEVVVAPSQGVIWLADIPALVCFSRSGRELWRDMGYGSPMSLAADPADGSCWVMASFGLYHMSLTGSEIWSGQFDSLDAFALNPSDGSLWVVECGTRSFVHVTAGGVELWRGRGFPADAIAVNPTDASLWVTDNCGSQIIHMDATGAELWRGGGNRASISPNPTDGSCWVAASGRWDTLLGKAVDSAVLHLAPDGKQLARVGGFGNPTSVSVNPADGSCWVADLQDEQIIHLAPNGSKLWAGPGFVSLDIAVNTTDSSVWVASLAVLNPETGVTISPSVAHLAADGRQLWRGGEFQYPMAISVNSADGSCWVGDQSVVHLAADGTELARVGGFVECLSVSVNSADGSCWVADAPNSEVAHIAADGTVLWREGGFDLPSGVSVNPTDGSCWVADSINGQLARLSQGHVETFRVGGFSFPTEIAFNPSDNSCWVIDDDQVVHLRIARFADLPFDHWAWAQVEACAVASIVQGYSDGTYRPTSVVTRDQMAVYISRALAGSDAKVPTGPAQPSFKDVPTDHWAYKYIEYAAATNVVQGYPGGSYRPGVELDRGQMAVFIARAIVTPTGDAGLAGYTPPTSPSFPDVATSFWAYKYIEYLKQEEIVTGYPDGLYHAEYACTRDQMAVYVARAFKLGG